MEAIICSAEEITLLVDETIYSRNALLKTCYWFTDRCYVFIYRHDPQHLAVNIRIRPGSASLQAVAGEFENALLDQQLRAEIERETATLRELIVAKAFAPGDLLEDPPIGEDMDPVELADSDPRKSAKRQPA